MSSGLPSTHPNPFCLQVALSLVDGCRNALLFLCCLLQVTNLYTVAGDIGTASSYGPPYTPTQCNGNRLDQFPAGNLFVAVSEGLWDKGAACGPPYRLRCRSGSDRPCNGDVRVVDFCQRTPCPFTILMSKDAFAAISHSPNAKINIEYMQI